MSCRVSCARWRNSTSPSIISEVSEHDRHGAAQAHEHSGTSIGAFVGGLYAREGDLISSAGRTKQFSGRMGNIWRILSDVTYPIVAYTTVSSADAKSRSCALTLVPGT